MDAALHKGTCLLVALNSLVCFHFQSITETIKKNFESHLYQPETVPKDPRTKQLKVGGTKWDTLLSQYIKLKTTDKAKEEKKAKKDEVSRAQKKLEDLNRTEQPGTREVDKAQVNLKRCEKELLFIEGAEDLVHQLEKIFNVNILYSKFPLFGFAKCTTSEGKGSVYLWQGIADAIASHDNKFVIVEFKVIDLSICEKPQYYSKFLHQCLVYAQLLKLVMNLDYLPEILLVAIDKEGTGQFNPKFFKDYPAECKDKLNYFKWSTDPPTDESSKLKLTDEHGTLFSEGVVDGPVNEKRKLREIFQEDATVEDLLCALRFTVLEISKPPPPSPPSSVGELSSSPPP